MRRVNQLIDVRPFSRNGFGFVLKMSRVHEVVDLRP